MKSQFLFALLTIITLLSNYSCASLSGLEEGRVLGENGSELIIAGNLTNSPDIFDTDFSSEDIDESIIFPNIELSYKRGISEKLDLGIKTNTTFNTSIFAKYQFVGDEVSTFALSSGITLESILGITYSVGVPIYASYYPDENITINFAPRYTYQSILNSEGSAGYLGGNFGILFGSRNKFGIDIGYYNVAVEGVSGTLINIGFGGKFRLGKY